LPGQRILTKDSDQFKGRTAFAGIFFGFSGIVCSVMAFMTRSEDRAVDLLNPAIEQGSNRQVIFL